MLGKKFVDRSAGRESSLRSKRKDIPKTSDRDILSNKVETLQENIENLQTAQDNFRGSISLLSSEAITQSALTQYQACAEICSTDAIRISSLGSNKVTLDVGKCILCGRCQDAAPNLFKLESKQIAPVKKRSDLVLANPVGTLHNEEDYESVGENLRTKINQTLSRSLAIRAIDAGSCNGCEVEITALNNPIYDIERFGIHFVASPRHADVLLVTGPASRNMEIALKRTYEATPDPKIVIAVGACACSGGIFGDSYSTTGGIDKVVPVDLYIAGCPPRPYALLYGLLAAVDRIKQRRRSPSR